MSAAPIPLVIVGGGGYVAAEALRLLHHHPGFALKAVVSSSAAGLAVTARHPHATRYTHLLFSKEIPWTQLGPGPVLWFLALEQGKAQHLVPEIRYNERQFGYEPGWVVDCSGDFRFPEPHAYEVAYGKEHAAPEEQERFRYCIPELHRRALNQTRAIANPGCMATASLLALAPLARRGLLAGHIGITAITGSSGAGATLRETSHHPWRSQNVQIYRTFSHQHEPEIRRWLPANPTPWDLSFVPVRGPFVRGISAIAQGQLREEIPSAELTAIFNESYGDSPFYEHWHEPPSLQGLLGTNRFRIFATTQGKRFLVNCAIDNLVRGAAGQALQNANLLVGYEEATGLDLPGLAPI